MFLTKPFDAAVLNRFGDESAKAAKTTLDETLKVCMYESCAQELASVGTRPTPLVVGGIYEPNFSPGELRGMVASIPCARLALSDSNHEVPIEQPREFAALLEACVAGLG
jgi:hypothetical protein